MMTRILALASLWGAGWALFLQFSEWGRWLAIRRTWITVVIGVGIDLVLLTKVLDMRAWWRVFGVIAASSVGIIVRSLANELAEDR